MNIDFHFSRLFRFEGEGVQFITWLEWQPPRPRSATPLMPMPLKFHARERRTGFLRRDARDFSAQVAPTYALARLADFCLLLPTWANFRLFGHK